jgi:hypothetical protein
MKYFQTALVYIALEPDKVIGGSSVPADKAFHICHKELVIKQADEPRVLFIECRAMLIDWGWGMKDCKGDCHYLF